MKRGCSKKLDMGGRVSCFDCCLSAAALLFVLFCCFAFAVCFCCCVCCCAVLRSVAEVEST